MSRSVPYKIEQSDREMTNFSSSDFKLSSDSIPLFRCRLAANREMAELRYRYPNWKYSGSRGQEVLKEAASGNRQKRRRYNKKTPTKTIELRDIYVNDLFNGATRDASDSNERK